MLVAVADTHTAIWYVYGDKRLSSRAKSFLDAAYARDDQVGFSTITIAEMIYLEEKGRILQGTLTQFLALVDEVVSLFVEVPFDRHIAETLLQLSRASVPDLPDRIIAATALHMGVPLISRDAMIQAAGVATIW